MMIDHVHLSCIEIKHVQEIVGNVNSSPTWACEQFPLAMEGGRDILCYDGVEKQCSILREYIIIAGLLGSTIQLPLCSLLFSLFCFGGIEPGIR